jgi:hypothetical protein
VRPRTRHQRFDDGRQWLCKDEYGLVPQYLQSHKLNLAAQQAAQHVRTMKMPHMSVTNQLSCPQLHNSVLLSGRNTHVA